MTIEQQMAQMDELLRKFCKEHNMDYNKVDKELLLKNIIVQSENNRPAKDSYIHIMKDVVKQQNILKKKEILDKEILLLEFEGEILEAQLEVMRKIQQEKLNETIRV